ncbi:MAG: insulinase family protein [Ruminococcaceae bacterium]|nr:insulinase family protein [Oscillospiraceae bacterium]
MDKQYYPALDETLCRATLPNGLRVLVVPKQGFTKKLAYFVTDFGAVHTDFSLDGEKITVPAGVAHYLEHKIFDLPGRDVSAEFAAMGAMVNAFTSYDLTAYYFSCTENFEDCLDLLLEFVSTPYFTEESVEKERGIIDQEIGMVADEPGSRVFENLMTAMYRSHPIRIPILGTSQTIRDITPEILHTCHRAFYHPGNMLLCVVGDVDPEVVCAQACRILGDAAGNMGQKAPFPEEPTSCPESAVTAQMDIAMPMFSMGFKCPPIDKGEAAIRREFIGDLAAEVLFGEASALYLQLYAEGVIDSSFGGGYETIDGCALLNCGGDSQYPEKVRDAILAEAAGICQNGIPQDTFLRLKRSAMGRRIRDLDSFDSTCFRLCAYEMTEFDYFRFPELYGDIEAEEVCQFIRQVVRPEGCSLSIIYPIKEENP